MEELVTEFNGKLAVGLEAGQYFVIDVTLAKNPKSFHISLAPTELSKSPDAQKTLHVVVKLDELVIEALTVYGGFQLFPFYSLEDDIKVIIQVCDSSFNISLNGDHKAQVPIRDTYLTTQYIQIAGDIKAIRRMDHRKSYPDVWPPSLSIPYHFDKMFFSNDIPIRFKPGHLMVMTARCYGQPTGNFYINMKHAHNETLLMHVSVDFKSKTVYRSHLDPTGDNYFGHAFSSNSTEGGFPFDFNRPFKIGIACKEHEFLMAVNGLYFCSFAYTDPENCHPGGIVPRPYNNVLSNIVGLKVFARHGAGIKVTGVDHIDLGNPECTSFEHHTRNEYEPSEHEQCLK